MQLASPLNEVEPEINNILATRERNRDKENNPKWNIHELMECPYADHSLKKNQPLEFCQKSESCLN